MTPDPRAENRDATSWQWRLAWFGPVVGTLYAGYQVLNRWHWRPPSMLPLTALDEAIPLWEWTVWPYLFLAGCVGLMLGIRGRANFRRAMWALAIAYPIDLLVFAIFPTTYPRVTTVPGAGLNHLAFNFLFTVDTPANCFPSGHITAPLIAFWGLAREYPRWRRWLWITFSALALTILTTKQHYVADLVGGLATGVFGIWASGRFAPPRRAGGSVERDLPQPRFNLGLFNILSFRRDPLRFLERLTLECGPVSSCRLAWLNRVIVNDPVLARSILSLPHTASNKSTRSVSALRRICGESVLTADHESWFRRRRLVQPAFHRQSIEQHVETMAALSADMIREWRAAANAGRPIDVNVEVRRVTFRFVSKALFDADPTNEIAELERCISVVLTDTWHSIRSPFDLANRLPTRRRREFRAALAGIDSFIMRLIRARRVEHRSRTDLLSMLLSARDAESGEGLSDTEIRNECVTLLIAGYDTTANALGWAMVELSRNPAITERLEHEISTVLQGRPPTLADFPRLRYTHAVFLETIRLYPPIWILERNLDEAVAAGGWSFPAGSQVLISPWILHRNPDYWPQPESFEPARFIEIPEENPAFLPFGIGPRMCIGKQLSLLEGQVFLAVVAQAGRLRPPGRIPPREAGLSLRPRGMLPMHFHPHVAAKAVAG